MKGSKNHKTLNSSFLVHLIPKIGHITFIVDKIQRKSIKNCCFSLSSLLATAFLGTVIFITFLPKMFSVFYIEFLFYSSEHNEVYK